MGGSSLPKLATKALLTRPLETRLECGRDWIGIARVILMHGKDEYAFSVDKIGITRSPRTCNEGFLHK
jgi:hypothetical protein